MHHHFLLHRHHLLSNITGGWNPYATEIGDTIIRVRLTLCALMEMNYMGGNLDVNITLRLMIH